MAHKAWTETWIQIRYPRQNKVKILQSNNLRKKDYSRKNIGKPNKKNIFLSQTRISKVA